MQFMYNVLYLILGKGSKFVQRIQKHQQIKNRKHFSQEDAAVIARSYVEAVLLIVFQSRRTDTVVHSNSCAVY